jgi:hypothetical protein
MNTVPTRKRSMTFHFESRDKVNVFFLKLDQRNTPQWIWEERSKKQYPVELGREIKETLSNGSRDRDKKKPISNGSGKKDQRNIY